MLNPELTHYAEKHTEEESPVLKKLNRETHLKVMHPRMLSGHMQGKLLQTFSQMMQPRQILEIGTYTGYSAICLSAGLCEGGILHTIDVNAELEDMVRQYFHEAGIEEKIKYYIGHALEIIPTINEIFDLVFIDADKENYLNYYKMVFDKVRKGGYIIADNVLWDGKVLTTPKSNDTETKGIIEFNEFVHHDDRVENMLLPIRDGLMVMRKK